MMMDLDLDESVGSCISATPLPSARHLEPSNDLMEWVVGRNWIKSRMSVMT